MGKYTTFSAPFLCSSLPPETKMLYPRIYFRFNTTYIENQYYLYSRTYIDGKSMLEGVDFNVSNSPVVVIRYLCIIVAILSVKWLIIFVLDISNVFQNIILPNTEESVYLSLPHLYLLWFKIKWPEHPLESINPKELCIDMFREIVWQNGQFWGFVLYIYLSFWNIYKYSYLVYKNSSLLINVFWYVYLSTVLVRANSIDIIILIVG